MSLSPFVSFQSRFVTYLLTYPRIKEWQKQEDLWQCCRYVGNTKYLSNEHLL